MRIYLLANNAQNRTTGYNRVTQGNFTPTFSHASRSFGRTVSRMGGI